jgi:NADH dehydrogenase FAD-containing subunit
VFAGAGHASLIALRRLARRPLAAEVTVVSHGTATQYTGMVPGWIEGLYPEDALSIPLKPFTERVGARFVSGDVAAADGEHVRLADGRELPFDLLVVDTGAVSARYGPLSGPGIVPAKPFVGLIRGLRPRLAAARSFLVGGGGTAGLEVAFALRRRRPDAVITVVERGPELLPKVPRLFRRRIARHLAESGIDVRLGARLVAVEFGEALLADGAVLQAACTLAMTGAAPQSWLDETPFARASDGFLAVDGSFRSLSHPNVLAVGDVATRSDDPRPKAGVFAVRSGPPLARAVRAFLAGEPLPAARLQREALVLLSLGGRRAMAKRNGFVAEGRLCWRLKDYLDRSFVRQFVG